MGALLPTVHFGNLDGHLYAHNLESGDLLWAFHVDVPDAQVAGFALADGRVYVDTSVGVVALGENPDGSAVRGRVLAWKPES